MGTSSLCNKLSATLIFSLPSPTSVVTNAHVSSLIAK
ncbi:hypothetical protein A2U01_0086126, partial [Trifolium medium]|nr:hypothetical protein [Trifolium medium]